MLKPSMRLRSWVFLLCILTSPVYAGENFIVPPKHIQYLAQQLSYKDFPTAVDILASIRTESSFNPKAFNKEESKVNPQRKVPPSIGLMQVQGGSFNIYKNMKQGTARLREYYLRFGRSKVAAVKSYNIGPSNYKDNYLKISGEEYYRKWSKHRLEYVNYYKRIHIKINTKG